MIWRGKGGGGRQEAEATAVVEDANKAREEEAARMRERLKAALQQYEVLSLLSHFAFLVPLMVLIPGRLLVWQPGVISWL